MAPGTLSHTKVLAIRPDCGLSQVLTKAVCQHLHESYCTTTEECREQKEET